jgi:primosomal protein N' (replication factor Y)
MTEKFIEVVPTLRLPKKFDKLDYSLPGGFTEKIRTGSLVFIPFRNKTALGVVLKVKSKSEIPNLKPIKSIAIPGFEVPEDIIKTAEWMEKFLGISKTLAWKTILPDAPLKKKEKPEEKIEIQNKMFWNGETKELAKKICDAETDFFSVKWHNAGNKNSFIVNLIEENLAKNKSILILEPRAKNALWMYELLKIKFSAQGGSASGGGKQIGIYLKKSPKSESFEAWKNFAEGKTKIIITTRAGIFLPTKNLGLFIFDDEDEADFKSADQKPYYDSRSVALLRSKWLGAKIVALSESPSVLNFARAAKDGNFLNLDEIKADTSIIDVKDEHLSKRNTIIGQILENEAEYALQNGKKVVLFLNRKDDASLAVCRDCGFIWKCANCGSNFKISKQRLTCKNCRIEKDMPLSCEKCQGTNIKFAGAGTSGIEKELSKIFPDKKILRVDGDSSDETTPKKELEEINKADIIIGTEYFYKNFLHPEIIPKHIGLYAIPLAENLFGRIDYRANEKAFSWIVRFRNLAATSKAKLLIQTYTPENPVIQMASADDLKFYNKELAERKKFSYPPATIILKIFIAGEKSAEREKQIKHIEENLMQKRFEVFSGIKKKNKKTEYFLTIKFLPSESGKIQEIVKIVPENWSIDINPI